jgi:hypothetical protein
MHSAQPVGQFLQVKSEFSPYYPVGQANIQVLFGVSL